MAAHEDETTMGPMATTPEEKYELITRNLQEVVGEDSLKELLKERDLELYWGTATTGRPHIAYFVPMCKLADFLRAGCHVTVLFADLHAYLDNMKAPWELLQLRVKYYEEAIKAMLESINVPLDKLKFVQGTDFQLSREYTLDVYRLSSLVSQRNAQKAGAEVVKQAAAPPLGGLLYPLLQALDEEYLKVDAQFGGVDQRKIFNLASEALPRIGYKKRIHLMNPMVPGLTGDKMSASNIKSKIDLLDSAKSVRAKVNSAYCLPPTEKDWESTNGVLAFAKSVVFPLLHGKPFNIPRPDKWGGPIDIANYEELVEMYSSEKLAPADLKSGVALAINKLLDPIRQKFQSSKELRELVIKAYPEESAGGNQQKKAAPKKKKNAPQEVRDADVSVLNIRVGRIVSAEKHPNADSLLVEKIDVGETEPRQVVSGIAKHFAPADLVGRSVCLVLNMKPNKIRQVESTAMILCASTEEKLALVTPPEGAKVGERVMFDGFEKDALDVLPPRRKYFETVSPNFAVREDSTCVWKNGETELTWNTSAGPCTAPAMGKDAQIR
eukprot:CAMPEP_0177632126 /NCGR_PEP_ID=MMETSP0447-20121125/2121_1 /TAXON_ID=0 /ORGANISM="Stygamoeba regulata, Strain BSH-02190019" /LENGTH=552 /DNA_ID=CAMNT_0019133665 /DNA_START=10 /DNA_END=1668 /DNA_ORIENTATION=+